MQFDPIMMPIYPDEIQKLLGITRQEYDHLLKSGKLKRTWIEPCRPLGSNRPHNFFDLVAATEAPVRHLVGGLMSDEVFEDHFEKLIELVFGDYLEPEWVWSDIDGHLLRVGAAHRYEQVYGSVTKLEAMVLLLLLKLWDFLERRLVALIFPSDENCDIQVARSSLLHSSISSSDARNVA